MLSAIEQLRLWICPCAVHLGALLLKKKFRIKHEMSSKQTSEILGRWNESKSWVSIGLGPFRPSLNMSTNNRKLRKGGNLHKNPLSPTIAAWPYLCWQAKIHKWLPHKAPEFQHLILAHIELWELKKSIKLRHWYLPLILYYWSHKHNVQHYQYSRCLWGKTNKATKSHWCHVNDQTIV
jgi:hypothetical protein